MPMQVLRLRKNLGLQIPQKIFNQCNLEIYSYEKKSWKARLEISYA